MPADALPEMDRIPLFDGLGPTQAARMKELLRSLSVKAHTTLMATDQPGETIFAVVSGTLRVEVDQLDGKTVILAFLGAGDTVGEMSLLEDTGRLANGRSGAITGRSATVVTVEPCRLLWLDRVAFQSCLETMPQLSINLLRVLSRRLRLANERIQVLARKDVAGKLAWQLVAFANSYGEKQPDGSVRIPLRFTQDELADIVGASRERVNQVIKKLEEKRLVVRDSGHCYVLPDPKTLEARYR
jgi:CRP/FNR family cyclic AMP-dependent transcriptional regulator